MIVPGSKYDNLYRKGSFFSIQSDILKKSVTIKSNLPYWQIYTPDEKRIAVEPMSFTGNVFRVREEMGEGWEGWDGWGGKEGEVEIGVGDC